MMSVIQALQDAADEVVHPLWEPRVAVVGIDKAGQQLKWFRSIQIQWDDGLSADHLTENRPTENGPTENRPTENGFEWIPEGAGTLLPGLSKAVDEQTKRTFERVIAAQDPDPSVTTFYAQADPETTAAEVDVYVWLQLRGLDVVRSHTPQEEGSAEGGTWVTALVAAFLNDAGKQLRTSTLLRPNELRRAAGVAVMGEVVRALQVAQAPETLYNLCNAMALRRYEALENVGSLMFCGLHHPEVTPHVQLPEPIPLTSTRGVRKLLETTSRTLVLLCDGQFAYGLGDMPGPGTELYSIQFERHGVWVLYRGQSPVMQVTYAIAGPPDVEMVRVEFLRCATRTFGDHAMKSVQRIWALVQAAVYQRRGTNVLISARADLEAQRLKSQATQVVPFQLTPAMMTQLTKIDGTVIMNPDGVCYAIGAILDGPVASTGNRVRGGRYNSAVMYAAQSAYACLLVVVSQDGGVDFISSEADG